MSQNAVFAHALDFAAAQCRSILTKYPDYHPMYTVGGQWKREGELWTHWCEGFYPGIYWLLHQHTGDAFWRQHAEAASKRLEPRRWDRRVHDLGFLFFSTYLRWYHLDEAPAQRQVLIDAGRTLALRRQIGGYLCSFIGPESLFIDIMMNVGITLWAARETNDEALRQIGIEHCRTTQKYLVRPDGGTGHEGIFDVTTGAFQRQSTHQGHAADSTWTRGLAWAIYGFAAAHRLSGENEFLETAKRCAECYLRRAPSHFVPPWDFDAPVPTSPGRGAGSVPSSPSGRGAGGEGRTLCDSSAAAITASGLLDLAEQAPEADLKKRYRTAAFTMLNTLCSDEFLADKTPEWEGILKHGVYHIHKNLGVDESVAWGDHFFVEALVKALSQPLAA